MPPPASPSAADAADPAAAAAASAAASGTPPPPEEWLRTARQGLDEPVTWSGLRELLREWREAAAAGRPGAAKPLGRMGRSRAVTAAYRAHRARVLQEWRTMSDYAIVAMLGWADAVEVPAEDDGGEVPASSASAALAPPPPPPPPPPRLKKAAGPLKPAGELPAQGLFTPNDFPYFFEPGLSHELLWAPQPLSESQIEAALARRLREAAAGGEAGAGAAGGAAALGEAAQHWVNPVELKSVPAIWHAHVVFRFGGGGKGRGQGGA